MDIMSEDNWTNARTGKLNLQNIAELKANLKPLHEAETVMAFKGKIDEFISELVSRGVIVDPFGNGFHFDKLFGLEVRQIGNYVVTAAAIVFDDPFLLIRIRNHYCDFEV